MYYADESIGVLTPGYAIQRMNHTFGTLFITLVSMISETWIQVVGLAAGVCTAISLLPQLIKIVREKRAEQLSLFYLFTLLVGLGLWIAYGCLRSDLPIILTNIVSAALNISVIILSVKYRKPHS